MTDEKILRLNALYKKSCEQGLTDDEKNEQTLLRGEYVGAFRNNMKSILDSTYILDENGNKKKLEQKK